MTPESVLLDFNLPNATTWFYFSFLLVIALFFKFSKLATIRNWDIITIFLLVPGLLLLPSSGQTGTTNGAPTWVSFLWLLVGSGFLLLRCFFDMVLIQRPVLGVNLKMGGMIWLAAALFICLSVVAFRPDRQTTRVESPKSPVLVEDKGTVGRPTFFLQLARGSETTLAMLCHLAVVSGLIVIGKRHFKDVSAGMAAATMYLLLPYTARFVGQLHHVWPTALIIWSIVFFRRPVISGVFFGVAAGTAFFPALLLPIWFSFYWKRGAGRFIAMTLLSASLCLFLVGTILWFRNDLGRIIDLTLSLPDWQPWKLKKPSPEDSVWGSFVHWAYRLPVSILYLAVVIVTAFWPSPKNLAHVLALSAAVLIGIQFWYADHGGVYILWYLPLFLLMIFRPNLSKLRPAEIDRDSDPVSQFTQNAKQFIRRLFTSTDDLVRVR